MNELLVFGDLHKYLCKLGQMEVAIPESSFAPGYNRLGWRGKRKFATLHGDKKYQCLILHVDPGNPESKKGKIIQKEIQEILKFDIKEMRSFSLKKHEVYIPLELIQRKISSY
ncbi:MULTISPECIES: hypothetical protein [Bacillaceae]|uniref:hypothetical protein n=1 Tax=Bacillaceae TaxID=186817 RepID=UPI00203F5E4C|nr:hypothetical protein [Caldibacillus thermoamylovorans]MCM3053924.1 hypothetical protein [Caldibacillus thermoamylovorans]